MTKPPVPPDDDTVRGDASAPGTPQKIGKYTIKREIARGGMGVVYEAIQEEPRRTVAVKIMKETIGDEEALQRFRYEAQLLARLRHPGIAQVYEAGTHDLETGSVPYFAMEYIPNARPLTEFAVAKKLGVRERLALFARVCDAVHHGHQRGIVHRDLKPSNILVDSNGRPRIIDFGVARSVDSDMAAVQTQVGQLIGSLQYMSPEQFDADPNDIDTRSDVYALGVILYELLCDKLPYDVSSSTIVEAAKMVREYTPPKLSDTSSADGDVETIASKALEKDRDQRYQSAHGMAADIRRYLNDEPISARPPSVAYQMRVFARRNKALITSGAVVLVALIVATTVSTTAWLRAERERARAEEQGARTLAAVEFLQNTMSRAVPREYGENATLRNVLDKASESCGSAFSNDPSIEADLRETLGWAYISVAELGKSEAQFKETVDLRRGIHGAHHQVTIDALSSLNRLYSIRGETKERQGVLEEILEAETAMYGWDHEETVGTRLTLASVFVQNGEFEKARHTAQEVYEAHHRESGYESEGTVDALVLLALIDLWEGKHDDALKRSREAYDTSVRVFGDDDDLTRQARSQLGATLLAMGRMDEAYELFGSRNRPESMGVIESYQGDTEMPREGSYVYVFWEPWCPFSQRAVPWLEDVHRRYRSEDLNVVGMTTASRNSTEAGIRDYLRANGVTYPVLKENGVAREHFEMEGTPFITFVRDGKLVWEDKLPTERFPEELFEALVRGDE